MKKKITLFIVRLQKYFTKSTIIIILVGLALLLAFNILQNFYLVEIPQAGGTFSEALVGNPRFINPVLAVSQVDKDIVELVYGSLVTKNSVGEIQNELAQSITVSEDGKKYTVKLRPDIFFHDGIAITADDVVYTIEKIKDPIVQSPLRANWIGVEIEKVSEDEVLFTLDKAYPLFITNLDIGIMPTHIWSKIASEEFPFSTQNIQPVGSGPFEINSVVRNEKGVITEYNLIRFSDSLYKPFLQRIVLDIVKTPQEQITLYTKNTVDAISGVTPAQIKNLQLKKTTIKNYVLPRVFSLFYKQEKDSALQQKEVRQVLDILIHKEDIIDEVFAGYAKKIDGPLPPTSPYAVLNEKEELSQEERITKATALLKKNSWKFDENKNLWSKTINDEVVDLAFTLYTPNTNDLIVTANRIRSDFATLQIPVTIQHQDIERLTQDVIRPRAFELLLFGYVTDIPADLYPFWHSSGRIDPGLNIAEYVNITTDKELESIRTETDTDKMRKSYEVVQKEIASDVPATFLFSPEFIYIHRENFLQTKPVVAVAFPEDRFRNIEYWYTDTEKILPFFIR